MLEEAKSHGEAMCRFSNWQSQVSLSGDTWESEHGSQGARVKLGPVSWPLDSASSSPHPT